MGRHTEPLMPVNCVGSASISASRNLGAFRSNGSIDSSDFETAPVSLVTGE